MSDLAERLRFVSRSFTPGQQTNSILNEAADEIDRLNARPVAMYARDLDGTGSLHPCAAGDRGAIPLYAVNASSTTETKP